MSKYKYNIFLLDIPYLYFTLDKQSFLISYQPFFINQVCLASLLLYYLFNRPTTSIDVIYLKSILTKSIFAAGISTANTFNTLQSICMFKPAFLPTL